MKEEILHLMQQHLPGPFKYSGVNIVCKCPFHKDGQERHASFGVNWQTGQFNCYSCHAKGGLHKFLELLGMSREAAFASTKHIQPFLEKSQKQHAQKIQHFFDGEDPFRAKVALPETMTGIFDYTPNNLIEKGFKQELLEEYGVGFDTQNNRVMYPLRDVYGTLVGFSGGAVSKDQIPKYKIYQGGRSQGSRWVDSDFGKWFDEEIPGYRCENHELIWNMHNIEQHKNDTLYVTEGFKACLWMIQAGYTNTVALMGSYASETQQRLLHRHGGNVVLCLDNDEAGLKAMQKIGELLWGPFYGRVKVLQYPTGHFKTQPDDYPPEQLREMLNNAVTIKLPPRRPTYQLYGAQQ